MADLVSEIISQGALDQLELANAQLELAVKNVNNVATAAKGIVIDFKGAGNIGELQDRIVKLEQSIKDLELASKKYEGATRNREAAAERAAEKEQRAAEKAVADADKKLKAAERLRAAQEKYGQSYVEQLKKEELAAEKLRQKQEAFGNAYIAQLEKEADALAKKTAKEQKEIDKLNNAYEQLKVRYNAAAAEAKQLAAAYGLTSVQAQQATKDAQEMAVQLKQIEASVGQHQRNVGDYAQSTFALSQVIREAPAFANSISTGLSAIGNNLPILFDEFGRLRETVGSTTKAIGIMFKSIFSFTNIFILALTAFQLFGKELFQVSKATQAANDALNKYNDGMKQIAATTASSIAQHITESQQLLITAKNTDLLLKTRLDAVAKFRKANEGLFDDYDNEQILLQETEEIMKRLTQATYARFVAEAYGKKAALAMQKKFELTTGTVDEKGNEVLAPIAVVSDKIAVLRKQLKTLQESKIFNDPELEDQLKGQIKDLTEEYKGLEDQLKKADNQVNKFNKEQQKALEELQGLSPQGDTDNLQKLKAELSVRKSIIETMQLAKGITVDTKASEVDKLISQDPEFGKKLKDQIDGIKQLEDLIDKLEGKGKKGSAGKKAAKDTTAKSESDLLRTEYELNKQRTEQNAAMLKEIADNEKNTLNQRLDAYMEYQSELFQAAVLERDYIVKQEQAKQAEIREKLKTAKGQEIENLNDQLIASNLRITMAAEKTAGEFIDIEKKQAEGRLAIIESANEKFIDAQKELLTKLTTGELALYSQEIENLKIALDTKEITRRQYNKRLAEVQKKQQIAFLQAEIEFDEKVLANLSLTAEKRKQFEEKLAKDKEAKLKAEKGIATPRKGGLRITDSVAKLFVPEDMENEEQYLQEFYDRTVELANQAANAIIEAKNRQFEAENARLDEQARKIEANYTEQSRLINATVKDETERYNQQQKLLAQTEAQQATIEDRKREVARRQAAAQKAASVAAIIQNTAVAIAAALKYTVGAAPIIALIAASGAVQLAAALNTPIPAYKEGTTYHKGGKFIAGDGGEKELIIAPNKTPYWSNSISTLYDEAEGTKVIPKSAMQYAMANTTSNVGNLSAAYDARNSAIIAETIGSIVSREFDKTGRKLATVIVNSQPKQHQTESVADELRKMRNLQGL
jgi:hypothetical protein